MKTSTKQFLLLILLAFLTGCYVICLVSMVHVPWWIFAGQGSALVIIVPFLRKFNKRLEIENEQRLRMWENL